MGIILRLIFHGQNIGINYLNSFNLKYLDSIEFKHVEVENRGGYLIVVEIKKTIHIKVVNQGGYLVVVKIKYEP